MPRFTDTEREAIQTALLQEGEKLFSAHGLKKVTVDDLAEAVNISKGSFYAFYQSKEHLFATINFQIQDRLFADMEKELGKHKTKPPKELAEYIIKYLFREATKQPILVGIDEATMQHLQRKLPQNVLAEHTRDDAAMVEMLGDYGIHFSEDTIVMAKVLQTIWGCSNMLAGDDDKQKVLDVLIGGIICLIK